VTLQINQEPPTPDLADLDPGYRSLWINTSAGCIFARIGGSGPPLLLLQGFSETHVMWHRVGADVGRTRISSAPAIPAAVHQRTQKPAIRAFKHPRNSNRWL
jgi:hypothetical protein